MKTKMYIVLVLLTIGVLISGCTQQQQAPTPTPSPGAGETPATEKPAEPATPPAEPATPPVPSNATTQNETNVVPPVPPAEKPAPAPAGTITNEMLSVHNSKYDCWIVYNGKVYDITYWLQGKKVNINCGIVTTLEEAGSYNPQDIIAEGTLKGTFGGV